MKITCLELDKRTNAHNIIKLLNEKFLHSTHQKPKLNYLGNLFKFLLFLSKLR